LAVPDRIKNPSDVSLPGDSVRDEELEIAMGAFSA
jgi:hypothetical protein